MRVSIRSKVVALLVLVGLVPLLAALALIYFGGREMRVQTEGRNIKTVAMCEAFARGVSFSKDIEKFLLVIRDPILVAPLKARLTPASDRQRAELDRLWKALPFSDPRIQAVESGPLADLLRQLHSDDRIVQAIVTDRFGDLVASTRRTEDYYQADEEWWQKAYNGGKGKIHIPPATFNDEASGAWTTDRAVPIMEDGVFLGVLKVQLGLKNWVNTMRFTSEEISAEPMVVRGDGRVLFRGSWEPLSHTLSDWSGPIASLEADGWRITEAEEIQGYAPIRIPARIGPYEVDSPRWLVILYRPKADVLGPIYWLSLILAGVGLLIIVLLFLGGVMLADKSIIRRIQRLESATADVARGEFSRRIPSGWGGKRWSGEDEIDDLAKDFNEMVAHVQDSHDALVAANQLKTNFIRVAGHELRTPVSYVIGMSQLLKDSTDTGKLLYAVQSMGAKAKRLEEIIQAIFKLMPDQRVAEEMTYTNVVLPELLEEIYLDAYPFVEKRGQRLVIESDEQLPSLQADREKLRDIVENLVMNAIQFTPDGGTIRIRSGRQLGGLVTIAVQDQGPGIPDAEVPHIFKPFYSGGDVLRHTSTEGYQRRGMGLGLAIVKHFVDLHKGTISLTTGPSGSTFTVSIPVEPLPAE